MKKQVKEITSHFQRVAEFWEAIGEPPVRPSRDELIIYEKHFKKLVKGPRKRVLIFGATPELRDMALKWGTEVTSVDASWEMLNAMNLLMKQDWHQEIIIKADWLKTPLRSNYYDIALGDNYINMLHWSQFKPMIKETYRLLKPGGYLIVAMLSYCPKEKLPPIETLIREYEAGRLSLGDLIAFADDNMRNPKTKMVCVDDKYKIIDKLYSQGKVKKETMKKMDPWRGPLVITKVDEEEFEDLYRPYFEFVAKEYGSDYQCCKYRPIYVLRAKA